MKITNCTTYVVGNPSPYHGGPYFVFVKLTTDNNISGFGEVYGMPFGPHKVTQLIDDTVERYVIDENPFNIEKIWRVIYSSAYTQHPDLSICGVISGIEIACWDIIGKSLGQPIYNLLGGQVHEKLRSYTYMYPEETNTHGDHLSISDAFSNPDIAPQRAMRYVDQGFTAIKLDSIMPMSAFDPRNLSLSTMDNAEKVIKNIREAVGNKCDILIGTHGQMTTSTAIRLAKRLEQFDPLWLEEPVPPENKKEMGRVAHSTTIPIATGERLATKYEFAELLGHQAAAIIQPALGRVGGILEAKKIAGMAEAHYVQIAPHLYCGPIEAAANIQIATCSPNFLIQESIETFNGFYSEIIKTPINWDNGYIIPSKEPGLGVELDEDVAKNNPYDGAIFPPMASTPL